MAERALDRELDRLYQLPLEQFTTARNGLAKTAGADAALVRALVKPPLPAWAVNQVFWQNRQTYDALVGASNDLREIHKAILAGKRADIRAATKEHDAAVAAALESALAVLSKSGQRATDQTRQAIVTTLRALPGEDPPGRLTRTLQPGGFEMLAGVPIAAGSRTPCLPPSGGGIKVQGSGFKDGLADKRAREEAAAAARRLREAEHESRRQEFERARAARDAERAAGAVKAARDAVEEAQKALAEAEAAATTAQRALAAAERRAAAAEEQLAAARNPSP